MGAGLCAVAGDKNTHGGGELIASNPQTVTVNNIPVIEVQDDAGADDLCPVEGDPHCNPFSTEGSGDVFVYNNPIHRNSDSRVCGATTVVTNQSTVFINI